MQNLQTPTVDPVSQTTPTPQVVMVYGGWRVKPESELYQQAEKLGYVFCHNGYTVRSGGQEGIMNAVSKGAARANSELQPHARREIEGITLQKMFKSIDAKNIGERTDLMAVGANVHIVMPGGKGTAMELFYIFQAKAQNPLEFDDKKLYVFRQPWENVLKAVYPHIIDYVGSETEYRKHMHFVDSVEEIFQDLGLN